MTVKDIRPLLWGPPMKLSIEVVWGDDSFNVSHKTPTQTLFDNFVVENVIAVDEYTYSIYLKERCPYVKEGEHAES